MFRIGWCGLKLSPHYLLKVLSFTLLIAQRKSEGMGVSCSFFMLGTGKRFRGPWTGVRSGTSGGRAMCVSILQSKVNVQPEAEELKQATRRPAT